jgi:uncharacterized glyoxalase superfamily protein PhnB
MGYGPIIPSLYVASMKTSLAFYESLLGFKRKWSWSNSSGFEESGTPAEVACPEVACLECGEALLFLETSGGGKECLLFLELPFVEDVDELAAKLATSTTTAPPEDCAWGSREFRVRDPDGHTLRFSCPLDRARPR